MRPDLQEMMMGRKNVKYRVGKIVDEKPVKIKAPAGMENVSVAVEKGKVYLFAEINPNAPLRTYLIRAVKTNADRPENIHKFLGRCIVPRKHTMRHFYLIAPEEDAKAW